jgi:hypothetical protein
LLKINHKRHNYEKRLDFQLNLFFGRKRDTLFGTRCYGVRSETSHRPRPSIPQNTLITKKGLLFQVNLFFGRKRDTLFGTRYYGVRSETSHRPRPSIPQNTLITKKGLLFQVNLFFWEKAGHVVMGFEAKRRTVHAPRYHKTH